jgi:hypothetical protein
MTGDYRVKLQLTDLDVIRLFRASYGTELDVDLLEKHEFTISEKLQNAILSKIKLTDLTLGQLLKMHEANKEQPPTADKLRSGTNITLFKRSP